MNYCLLTAGLLLGTTVGPVTRKLTIDHILLLNKAALHMDYQALESCIQFLKNRLEIVEKCDFSYYCSDYIKESIPKNILTCLRSINPARIQLAIDLLEVIKLQTERNIIDNCSSSDSIQVESSLYKRRLSSSSTGTQYTINLLEVDDKQSEISTVTNKSSDDFIHDESSLSKKRVSNSLSDIKMYIDSLEVYELQSESVPVVDEFLNDSIHDESSLSNKRLSNSLADIEMYIDSLEVDEAQSESVSITDKSSICNEGLSNSSTNIQFDHFTKTACKLISIDNDISEALLVC
ncbi:hypothetical protein CONCODRAFT_11048 [Conidiobolus coronatus NRRL 28638]|uniref:Uncharacterized protein n=1 Tax=Conidiobolus coronatus (strain ATCC 28846 / CBS 209.66 / NRRL 28638) TaxID=796925 RepID=A0A137NVX3_CONC2|nr:hypothetical protein CONCODRAFT_11048 [Conidiobolus coronatus NRRL 28638]|eukprot:KXN66985.1 hypothetical protein CONCODRAFT_11048 [Conidiobolus coronatus NRRL 28638]